jgi:hypothetical protein
MSPRPGETGVMTGGVVSAPTNVPLPLEPVEPAPVEPLPEPDDVPLDVPCFRPPPPPPPLEQPAMTSAATQVHIETE